MGNGGEGMGNGSQGLWVRRSQIVCQKIKESLPTPYVSGKKVRMKQLKKKVKVRYEQNTQNIDG